MPEQLNIAFFASSLISAYWNGAATYYRGIVRALAARGHRVTFFEPDAYGRQEHRDIPDPDWARVVVYPATGDADAYRALEEAAGADLIVKASGVGVFDRLLEEGVLNLKTGANRVVFWDVDAPATLDRVKQDPSDYFASLIPRYDAVFTYGGGPPVVDAYRSLGARECTPIYNALDPETHHADKSDTRFEGVLSFLGNRLPDREARVDEFFFKAARISGLPFVLGGAGWETKAMPANVKYAGHVYTRDHNSFNCTPRAVLNISRESMARYGYSPATRVFEAAGAGACIITDAWEGLDLFLDAGREALVASTGEEVAAIVQALSPERARKIGGRALRRVLAHHTYAHRALQVEEALGISRTAAAPVI
jgi:spore maturation protein CgeB